MRLFHRIKKLEKKLFIQEYNKPIVIFLQDAKRVADPEMKQKIDNTLHDNKEKIIDWLISEGLIPNFCENLIAVDSQLLPDNYIPSEGIDVLVIKVNINGSGIELKCKDKRLVL